VSYNVRLKSILQTVTTEFSGVAVKKIKMENHNKNDTVVVDNKPYDVRIGRFPILPNSTHTNKSTVNSNRFLKFQASRIQAALSEGKTEKAVLL